MKDSKDPTAQPKMFLKANGMAFIDNLYATSMVPRMIIP